MTRLDTLIAALSPGWGARRAGQRILLAQQNAWLANPRNTAALRSGANRNATSTRLNNMWGTTSGSPNADVLDDLDTLRARSRDLVRNDGRAAGMINTLTTSVIGTGIRPQPQLDHELLGIPEARARKIERQMLGLFQRWAPYADAGRRQSFYGMQSSAYWCKKINGDFVVLPQMVERPGRPLRFCLHAIESDRLNTPDANKQMGTVHGGVKVGDYGEPVGYYIEKSHPGDDWRISKPLDKYEFIPAEDKRGRRLVFHGYDLNRPGQSRGLPAFSSVLSEFHDLDEYREAERYAMRLSACIGLIINSQNPSGGAAEGTLTTVDGKPVEGIEPGMIWRGSDLDIHQVNPQRPGTNFEAFIRDIERTTGLSQGLTYELASKYFSEANYSSLRAGYVEARRYFQVEQQDFIHGFCQPSWEWLVEEAWLTGMLDLPSFYELRDLWLSVRWVPMGFDWVDPEKEVNASKTAIESGISTLAEETSKRTNGGDWKGQLQQRAAEEDMKRELGLPTAEMGTITTRRNMELNADGEPVKEADDAGNADSADG